MPDMLFILLLALVIFGPKKLPEIAGQIARQLVRFRQLKSELLEQISAEGLFLEEHKTIQKEREVGSQITESEPGVRPEVIGG
jgi:sec-independent protein translocase protein TatB